MAKPTITNIAVFCDFENVALGVRDAKYSKFDIGKVLEKLLLKGSIVVKKAYCDWERYKEFKGPMHEASFELIEIPHVRMSGKNSADIRMVVDALDLCYTKSHVDTFVIVSGDSDFAAAVSGGGGDAGVAADAVAAPAATPASPPPPETAAAEFAPPQVAAETPRSEDEKKQEAFDLVLATIEALAEDREEDEKIWGSMIKQALKRQRPGFNETYHGFRSFSQLLEEAQARKLIEIEKDEKSGGYVVKAIAS